MVCRSFWSALRWSGFTFARYSSIVLGFFVAESTVAPTELFPVVSSLQFRDVDLFHLKHRVHDAFGLLGVLLVQHVNQDGWSDLPRHAEFVLEPAARGFLPASRDKIVPIIVHFFLGLTVHNKRNRFVELELRTAV